MPLPDVHTVNRSNSRTTILKLNLVTQAPQHDAMQKNAKWTMSLDRSLNMNWSRFWKQFLLYADDLPGNSSSPNSGHLEGTLRHSHLKVQFEDGLQYFLILIHHITYLNFQKKLADIHVRFSRTWCLLVMKFSETLKEGSSFLHVKFGNWNPIIKKVIQVKKKFLILTVLLYSAVKTKNILE
jgi:hypothetical protein